MFPSSPMSTTVGALWMTVDSTSPQYPTDGQGGSTTTRASSTVLGAHHCVIEGITNVTAGSAVTVTLTDGLASPTDIDAFAIPADVGILSQFGVEGADRKGEFAAKLTSGTGTVILWYRIIVPAGFS